MREGFHTLTPYLTVPRPGDFSAFLQRAFGAAEHFRSPGSAGGMHIELSIRDSMLMVGGFADRRPDQESPCALHLYVENADAVYERALAAGATSLSEPVDQFYGDREAAVSDEFGNQWFIATHRAGASFVRPGRRAITPSLFPVGAGACLDYLKRAFGAEELESHATPDGIVKYAAARIGDSAVELGEAHGQWQPMPSSSTSMSRTPTLSTKLPSPPAARRSSRPPTRITATAARGSKTPSATPGTSRRPRTSSAEATAS